MAGRELVEAHRQNVQKVWRERIEQGDPAEEPLQKARVRTTVVWCECVFVAGCGASVPW